MPLQATSGAASYDAFGGGVPVVPAYIEEVFSTWLYAGTGASQTITNGIDLAGKGGLVWRKQRTANAWTAYTAHSLSDTARGINAALMSNRTDEQATGGDSFVTAFNANGFSMGTDSSGYGTNKAGENYASWTFRKQPKFFDVVTYTGDGTDSRVISHNLGSTPGCMTVKSTSATGSWFTWHRSITGGLLLNTTEAAQSYYWNAADQPTSTTLKVSATYGTNTSGVTYVAYLFAHNAGGFGLTGTDNVISCGSFTTDGSGNATVDLGYEPQWLVNKATNNPQNWIITDNMRGMFASAQPQCLFANTSGAEVTATNLRITSTGFTITGYAANQTSIYIAIRRGPMKVPTDGTKVFLPVSQNAAGTVTTNFPVDLTINRGQSSAFDTLAYDRLRGNKYFFTNLTDAEGTASLFNLANNTGYTDGNYSPPRTIIYWNFRRAPGFFDEVCYTGTGSATTFAHNLGVAPELMIVKNRGASGTWRVYSQVLGVDKVISLNTDAAAVTAALSLYWNGVAPTATEFTVGISANVNASGNTYLNYLFATCPGVSKVTNFTGNGSSQTINCGFTSGARFVMIKATSTTGNWTVFDSARGISAGGDPALYLNSTAAEVTGIDAIDADSTGFIVNQEGTFNLNASGVQYLVLAIA